VQRLSPPLVTHKNSIMKTLISYLLISILFIGCKKETTYPEITGTVFNQPGEFSNYYIVEIDNVNSQTSYPFFCTGTNVPIMPPPYQNCRNAIFITNLPDSLRVHGMKIVFSRYKNLGTNPRWSLILREIIMRDVEVYDAREKWRIGDLWFMNFDLWILNWEL